MKIMLLPHAISQNNGFSTSIINYKTKPNPSTMPCVSIYTSVLMLMSILLSIKISRHVLVDYLFVSGSTVIIFELIFLYFTYLCILPVYMLYPFSSGTTLVE